MPPGFGVQPRIRRSTAKAGSSQRTLASSTVIFGARLTLSLDCGTAQRSSSIPSRTLTSRCAGFGQSSEQIAGGVRRPDRLGHNAEHRAGVHARLQLEDHAAPVTSSPPMMARWTGAAPAMPAAAKCRFTQPWAGMSSTGCGIRAP